MKDALTNINLIKSGNKLIHAKSGVRNLQNILIGVDKTAWVKRGKKNGFATLIWLLTQIP